MQIGDLVKPKLHLELFLTRQRELRIETRWDDPQKIFCILDSRTKILYPAVMIVGQERTHRRVRGNRRGIAMMVPKIKILVGGAVVLIEKQALEMMFEPV